MSINKKVFLLFLLLFTILGFLFFTVLENRKEKSIEFENSLILKKISTLDKVLKDRLRRLNNISYEYSIDPNVISYLSKFKTIPQNYQNVTSRLNISYFILLNKQKKVSFSQVYDVNSNEYLDLPEEINEFFTKIDMDEFISEKESLKFLTLDYEKLIFSIERVDDIGYIFVARTLDSTFLSEVSTLLDGYLSFNPSYNMKKNSHKSNFLYDINRENEDYIYSNIELKDEIDNTSFYITIKIDRFFYKEIMSSNLLLIYLFVVSFIILNIVIYIFINKIFTKRLGSISKTIKSISKSKELKHEEIELLYDDEITYLSKKMNEMFKVINNSQNEKIKKERDFLQSVLDSQQHIIFITDGTNIHSANKRFLEIFKSSNSFLDNIALLDTDTKLNLLKIAKNHSSIDKPAKIKFDEAEHKYFVFDISRVEVQKYIICMNDVSKFNEKISQLRNQASIDELTACYNKSTITEYCKYWLQIKHFGLIILDIDKFKTINDSYGHLIGDYILRDIANLVKGHLHKNDVLGRFGGEEFIILIDDTSNNIENIANRIRKLIKEHTFEYDNLKLNITASLGCTFSENFDNYEEIFNVADEALYEAKNSGRNKVVYK